jgi:hypothetical protein
LSHDCGRQALSSPVLEPKTHGVRSETARPSVTDVMAARRDSLDWNAMEFEEVTDADDTPWAQI